MRLAKPRIQPLIEGQLGDKHRTALAGFGAKEHLPNLLGTFVATPDALAALGHWMRHLFQAQTVLPPRAREIVSLRIGYLCKCGYQFAQHVRIGLANGLTPGEIANIKSGAQAGWSSADAALIGACDDIFTDHFISEKTWRELCEFFDEQTRMYIVYTAAQFVQICILLNTFGVQGDPGLQLDQDLIKIA